MWWISSLLSHKKPAEIITMKTEQPEILSVWRFPAWLRRSSFTLNAFLLLIDGSFSEHVLDRAQIKRLSYESATLTLVGLAEKLVVPYLCWFSSCSCPQTHSLWNTPPIRVCTYLLPFPSILAGYPECLLSALYSFCVLIHTLRFPLMGLIFRTQSTYPSYMTLSVGDLHKKTSKPRRGLGLQTGLECVSRWAVNCTDVLMLLVAWEKKWMN